jgi:hypothetical protein
MSKMMRLIVLLTSLVAATSPTAGAVTWHNAGDTAFTATGGSFTYSVTGVQFRCSSSDVTGSAPASSTALTYVMTGTLTTTGCTSSGVPNALHCNYAFTTTTAPVNHVSSGTFDLTCGIFDASGTKICHIEGQTPVTYRNPETGLAAQFVLTTSTSLRTTNGAIGCPLGSGEPFDFTPQVITVTNATGGPMTPHAGPTLVRTA